MWEVYCEPNIPKNRVRRAFISAIMPHELEFELNDLGIITYRLGSTTNIGSELRYHPDVLVNNFRTGVWMCESNARYMTEGFPEELVIESESELGELYPYDCLFNNFRLKDVLVCSSNADYLIQANAKYEGIREVNVPQSYTKCSSIIVNNQAVITCDYYIEKILKENGYDTLLIDNCHEIGLRGFSHGLPGGCAALLSDNLLGFTGNLHKFKHGDNIIDFCANHHVDAYSLSSNNLYDYGGILPITEITFQETMDTKTCVFNNNEYI